MNELAKIFGTPERLRLLRFLLKDSKKEYTISDIEEKTKIKIEVLRKELLMLVSIGMIEKYKTNVHTFVSGKVGTTKEATVYKLIDSFKYKDTLSSLVLDYTRIDRDAFVDRLKGYGRIKLLILSGVFTGDIKSRLDVLYVGEAMKVKDLEKAFASISIELGRDIRYALMDVEEYIYRQKMFDSFLVEVMDSKKDTLIDKITKY